MIKVILFDCDGVIVKRDKYFSQRLADLGMKLNAKKVQYFFENNFLLCETGKADLKQELSLQIKDWGWEKSVDELLAFWFDGEAEIDENIVASIINLRQKGVKCHLVTDQEKYRTEYLWQFLGLKNYFDHLYSSCELGFLKRDYKFWEAVLCLLSYSKDEVLVWDDDQKNVESAKIFGFNVEFYENYSGFEKIMKEKYQF